MHANFRRSRDPTLNLSGQVRTRWPRHRKFREARNLKVLTFNRWFMTNKKLVCWANDEYVARALHYACVSRVPRCAEPLGTCRSHHLRKRFAELPSPFGMQIDHSFEGPEQTQHPGAKGLGIEWSIHIRFCDTTLAGYFQTMVIPKQWKKTVTSQKNTEDSLFFPIPLGVRFAGHCKSLSRKLFLPCGTSALRLQRQRFWFGLLFFYQQKIFGNYLNWTITFCYINADKWYEEIHVFHALTSHKKQSHGVHWPCGKVMKGLGRCMGIINYQL